MASDAEELNHTIYFDQIVSFNWLPKHLRSLDDEEYELSEDDLKSLKAAYETQFLKTTIQRFVLNLLPVLFTGFIFHLLYWTIKAAVVYIDQSDKHKFSWDWSREFQSIDETINQLEVVKAFIDNPPKETSSDSVDIDEDTKVSPKMTLKKAAVRTVSFWYNEANPKAVRLSHVITGLFLGRIPHKTPEVIIDFVNDINPTRPLGLVVSVVEKDELRGDGFLGAKMVKPTQWTEQGIEHHHISMIDFTSHVDIDDSIETIKKMHACIESGKSVYIHCKAGRSRSAMFCIIYLCSFIVNPSTQNKYTVEEALELLKNARNNVDIGQGKKNMAQEIVDQVESCHHITPMSSIENNSRVDMILASQKIKDEVLRLPALDALRRYKIRTNNEKVLKKSSDRGKRVDQILKTFEKPYSEEWFFTLIQGKGIFGKFIKLGPLDEQKIRQKLIDDLREQVVEHIKDTIGYTYEPEKEFDRTEESSASISSP